MGALFGVRKYHEGGVVPGRAGQEVPILAMAGETIRTREQERSLQQQSGGLTVVYQGTNYGAEWERQAERNARRLYATDSAQRQALEYGQ